jgi:hypothetical protein
MACMIYDEEERGDFLLGFVFLFVLVHLSLLFFRHGQRNGEAVDDDVIELVGIWLENGFTP